MSGLADELSALPGVPASRIGAVLRRADPVALGVVGPDPADGDAGTRRVNNLSGRYS